MDETLSGADRGVIRHERHNAASLGITDWLGLAAAPTFVIMALLTGVVGDGKMAMMCSTTSSSSLSGMVPMYLLMGAFHSAPWLKLIASRRSHPHLVSTLHPTQQ
jgi:hypothetical protein